MKNDVNLKTFIAGLVTFILVWLCPTPTCWSAEILINGAGKAPVNEMLKALPQELAQNQILRSDIVSLFLAYEGYCVGLETAGNGKLFVIMNNRAKFIYDDGKKKSFNDKLENPDLKDMLEQTYPLGQAPIKMPTDYDPGRFRVTDFFKAVYGSTPSQVTSNMGRVKFCGKTIKFNSNNGAAKALERVGAELENTLKSKPELAQYIFPLGGTFSWRVIAGTTRLSPHSFGMAIDLNPKRGVYWRGQPASFDVLKAVQEYPQEIVAIFEKNGFIWGGKWAHFDLMHFEYRPELFLRNAHKKGVGNEL